MRCCVAQSLDPVSSIVARDVAVMHFYRRDFETALEQCDHTIELNPHFAPAYWTLGLIQEQRRTSTNRPRRFSARSICRRNMPRMHGALGADVRAVGPEEAGARDARASSKRSRSSATSRRWSSPWIHFALDQTDLGFRVADEGVRGPRVRPDPLKVDPRFDPLRTTAGSRRSCGMSGSPDISHAVKRLQFRSSLLRSMSVSTCFNTLLHRLEAGGVAGPDPPADLSAASLQIRISLLNREPRITTGQPLGLRLRERDVAARERSFAPFQHTARDRIQPV